MATIRLVVKEMAEKKGVKNPFMLAKETGLTYGTCYSLWQGRATRVDLKTLARLCEAFRVKPGQLLELQQGK